MSVFPIYLCVARRALSYRQTGNSRYFKASMASSCSDTKVIEKKNKSKARWEILRSAIVDKKLLSGGDFIAKQSVRRFDTFELFIRKQCNCIAKTDKRLISPTKDDCSWFSYTCKDIIRSQDVWIQHSTGKINLKDATSFNNTGNVCIWPSEEVLAYYCILHSDKFNFKSVVELGGGSSSLAGMCVALNAKSAKVLLTDGNLKCVESLKKTIEMNLKHKKNVKVSASLLRWDDLGSYHKHANAFDYVLCADCLFFDEFRQSLVDTIHFILKPGGFALVFAPRRGKTLGQFVGICEGKFTKVSESDHYCHIITRRHEEEDMKNELYNPDIHFPILVELMK